MLTVGMGLDVSSRELLRRRRADSQAYRKLGDFRVRYPSVPITALTASATSDVRNDMLTILNMPKTSDQGLAQWVEPFNRKNLFYEVRHLGGRDRQGDTIEDIIKFIRSFSHEAEGINARHNVDVPCITGLVYCRFTANVSSTIGRVSSRSATPSPTRSVPLASQPCPSTPSCRHISATRLSTTGRKGGWSASSPPSLSGWAWTSRMSAMSCTTTCRNRSRVNSKRGVADSRILPGDGSCGARRACEWQPQQR